MKVMQFVDKTKTKNSNTTGKFRFINTISYNQKQIELNEKDKLHPIKNNINDKILSNTYDIIDEEKQPNVTNNICIIIKNSENNKNQRSKPNNISFNSKNILKNGNKDYANQNKNLKYINYTEYNNTNEIEEKPLHYTGVNTESNDTETNKQITFRRKLSKKQKKIKDLNNKIKLKQQLANNKKISVKKKLNKTEYGNCSKKKKKSNTNNYYNANRSEQRNKNIDIFNKNNYIITNSDNKKNNAANKNEYKYNQNEIDKLKHQILNSYEENKINYLPPKNQIFNDIPMTNIQTCKNYVKEDKIERQEKFRKSYNTIDSNREEKEYYPLRNMRFSQSIEKKREMLGIPLNKNEFTRMSEKMEEELNYQKLLEVEKKLTQYKKNQEEIMKDYERRKIAQQNKKENKEQRLHSLNNSFELKTDIENNLKSCKNENRKKSDLNKFNPFNYPAFVDSLKNNSCISVRRGNYSESKEKKRAKFNNYNDLSPSLENSNKNNNYGIFSKPIRNSNIMNFKKNKIKAINCNNRRRPISIKFKDYNQNYVNKNNYASNSFYNDNNNNYINKSIQSDYNNFNYTNNSFHNNYNYYNYNNNNINKNYNTNSIEMKEKIRDYINLEEAKKKDLEGINSYQSKNINNNSKLDSYIKFITKETDRSKNTKISPSLEISNNIFADESYYDRLKESSNMNKSFGGGKIYENYAIFSDCFQKSTQRNYKNIKNENTPTNIKKFAIKNEISEFENEEEIKTIRVVQKRKKKVQPAPNKMLQKIVLSSKKIEDTTEKKTNKKAENNENVGMGISAIRRINMQIQNYKNKNKNFAMKKRKKYEKKPQNKSLSLLINNKNSKLIPQNKSIRTLPDQNQRNTLDASFGDKC